MRQLSLSAGLHVAKGYRREPVQWVGGSLRGKRRTWRCVMVGAVAIWALCTISMGRWVNDVDP